MGGPRGGGREDVAATRGGVRDSEWDDDLAGDPTYGCVLPGNPNPTTDTLRALTGALTAWYLNATGQTEGTGALRHNLSVGPPSLEQIAFSVKTASGSYDRPGLGVTVVSRVLDGPRRIWHNIT